MDDLNKLNDVVCAVKEEAGDHTIEKARPLFAAIYFHKVASAHGQQARLWAGIPQTDVWYSYLHHIEGNEILPLTYRTWGL